MPFKPIKRLDIEKYGCIQQASFVLTPLHALIGPNDSGKSTTLRALRTVVRATKDDQFPQFPDEAFQSMLGGGSTIRIFFDKDRSYSVSVTDSLGNVRVQYKNDQVKLGALAEIPPRITGMFPATMVRFDPNMLRRPTAQIVANQPIRFEAETGLGLASVYQAINSRDVDVFVGIRDKVRKLFPTVQNILVPTLESNQVTIQAKLVDGTVVPVEAMSEGLLYFLGFLALQHLTDARLFLIEEPENGLHPARISEVMAILREISKSSQAVIATHSPLVVNELSGDEVSIVTRDPSTGTKVQLLKDVPGFEEAAKVYQPGEFWVSYCDGEQETPLLTGSPRQ